MKVTKLTIDEKNDEKSTLVQETDDEFAISVENLVKIYNGKVKAVNDLTIKVRKGEIFGFLGPNGAGKTTTIMILSTLLQKTSGKASVNGFDVMTNPDKVRRSIGVVFQEPALDLELTAIENLQLHADLHGLTKASKEKRIKEVLMLVDLVDQKDWPVKNYSGGMKRRLEIARGLIHAPSVLLLWKKQMNYATELQLLITEGLLLKEPRMN
ncbi:MAG: ABC transporter ATP-binding protein [Candidatus Helarchaeota archaeon]